MNRRSFLKSAGALSGFLGAGGLGSNLWAQMSEARSNQKKYNVLFIAVDDMRDWTEGLKGYGGKVYTPNQKRLAAMGVEFLNAHASSTICCPSRTSILTGQRSSTTGVYGNSQWWKPHLPEIVTLPVHFRQNGYYAFGAGKIHHHTPGFNPTYQWDEYYPLEFKDQEWFKEDGTYKRPPKGVTLANLDIDNVEFDWGDIGRPESEYEDAMMAEKCIDFLKQKQEKPFFLAYGSFRPHMPWFVPQKYIDMYPLESIKLPEVPDDDMDDIPPEGIELSKVRRSHWLKLKEWGRWKEAVQHYLASITFADAQVGKVLDALDKSPYADNTIVVYWSDHGWHLGEKHHFHKMTLWEEATRVPFYVSVPGGLRGRQCARTVSLLDMYPTLIELCSLSPRANLDGHSLVPLLDEPEKEWPWLAITEYKRGQCSVRTEDWRYIRYSDGTEELYDHNADAHEWKNLANDPKYKEKKDELAKWATKEWAPAAPKKDAYDFNEQEYWWINKQTQQKVRGQ